MFCTSLGLLLVSPAVSSQRNLGHIPGRTPRELQSRLKYKYK
jgi:hypothetical protein